MVDKVQIETEDNKATLTVTKTIFPGTYFLCSKDDLPPSKKDVIIIIPSDSIITINTDNTFTIKVKSDNQPVTTGTVTIYEDNNIIIENATLNNDGEYQFTYNKSTTGHHRLKAVYNGTSEYIAKQSDSFDTYIVNKDTKITFEDIGSGYVPFNVTCKVTTTDNFAVPEGECIAKINGLTIRDNSGEVIKYPVNSSGIVLIPITQTLSAGYKTLAVSYQGTDKFNSSTASHNRLLIR